MSDQKAWADLTEAERLLLAAQLQNEIHPGSTARVERNWRTWALTVQHSALPLSRAGQFAAKFADAEREHQAKVEKMLTDGVIQPFKRRRRRSRS